MTILKKFTKLIIPLTITACLLAACGKEKVDQTNSSTIAANPTAEATANPTDALPSQTSTDTTSANSSQASSNTASATPSAENAQDTPTPTALHGALSVEGAYLVDQNGDQFQLYGMSTHGIAWFPQFVNQDAFQTLRDDWNTNCIRIAMYTQEYGGYCSGGNKEDLNTLVKNGVEYATELGMYAIIDWHILSDQDPNVYKEEAISFFQEMSSYFADYTNVLYEICNEPNGYATWDSVKSYAEEVIPIIRANDSDAVIIVGTPTWSQDIHLAAENPLEYDNIMYAMHFYAGTHKDDLRSRLETCVTNGLPVFISEFGMCDASGNGGNDFDSTTKWFELLEKYNISFCCWNLANKDESSSVFKASCQNTANWTDDDLNESGKWIREYFKNK